MKHGLSYENERSFEDYILNDPFDFLIASAPPSSPRLLHSVKSGMVVPKEEEKIAALGTGGSLAYYVLTEAIVSEIDCDMGVIIAAHAVNAAKDFDPYCGGKIQIGMVRSAILKRKILKRKRVPFSYATLLTEDEIKKIETIIASVAVGTQKIRFEQWKQMESESKGLRGELEEKWSSSSSSVSSSSSSSINSSTSSSTSSGGTL
jgi:hypothetical protein